MIVFLKVKVSLGSTPIREIFNEAQKDSPIKNWMYSVPESELDDPTGELQRLQMKVITDLPICSGAARIFYWRGEGGRGLGRSPR